MSTIQLRRIKKNEMDYCLDPLAGRWKYDICQANVDNLKLIMNGVPDLKIVVSSTWRIHYSVDELKVKLSELLGISPDRIVGKTLRLFQERGHEIKAWIDSNDVDKFAIIDDDSDMEDLIPHFFQTTNAKGLTADIAKSIIRYFNEAS